MEVRYNDGISQRNTHARLFSSYYSKLIHDKHWKEMNEFNRIQSIYLNTHNQQVTI